MFRNSELVRRRFLHYRWFSIHIFLSQSFDKMIEYSEKAMNKRSAEKNDKRKKKKIQEQQ